MENTETKKKKNRYPKCEHDKVKKYCRICSPNTYCEHGPRKEVCRICSPKSFCIHNKHKSVCVECGGSQTCKHKKIKARCKICGGSGVCPHGILKQGCKECNGSAFCAHGIEKTRCRTCGGSAYCIHDKLKKFCKECHGASICKHNIQRSHCKECMGSTICEHKLTKKRCKKCTPDAFCEHGIKDYCSKCHGRLLCPHNKRKQRCKECGGGELCKMDFCETKCSKKYDGYCLFCYIHLFPDKPVARNYRTKEKHVTDYILEKFSNYTWIANKKVPDGCSKRRPDLTVDLGYQLVMVEIDENQHHSYDCSCENKRLMEISKDSGHRNIVFIRFNPDGYVDKDNKRISTCWRANQQGILVICKSQLTQWEDRLKSLKKQITYWTNPKNKTDKLLEVVQLYYDENIDDSDSESDD